MTGSAIRLPPTQYGVLRLLDGRWIMSDVAPHVSLRLKAVFPQIDKTKIGKFSFPHTPMICCDLIWFIDRYPMAISASDREALAAGKSRFDQDRAAVGALMQPEWAPDRRTKLRPGKRAFVFQEKAIELALHMRRLLVLDEGGLGKTITGIGALLRSRLFPAAVVVEPHLPRQWRSVIHEYSTMRAHVISSTVPYNLPPADVYVFRYSNIGGWVDVASTGMFRSVIFDEVQSLRHGAKTVKGKAASAFLSAAELVIGLSATPIYNYGDELHTVLDYIAPGMLGSRDEFLREWCKQIGSDKWAVRDPKALGTFLRDQNLVIRRTYDDDEVAGELGNSLPPANRIVVNIPYDKKLEQDSFALCRSLAIRVMQGGFQDSGQAARELDQTTRRITGVAKAKYVAAYVKMIASSGERVLLAGWHHEVYDIWANELREFNPVKYTGTETGAQKDIAKNKFVGGGSRVMMISLRSGVGLDGLQRVCNTLVIGELDWSPQVIEQLIWRLRRLGQRRWPVNCVIPFSEGGSDPVMASVLELKASQSQGIVDPLKSVEQPARDVSRIKMLAQRYLDETQTAISQQR